MLVVCTSSKTQTFSVLGFDTVTNRPQAEAVPHAPILIEFKSNTIKIGSPYAIVDNWFGGDATIFFSLNVTRLGNTTAPTVKVEPQPEAVFVLAVNVPF